MYVDDPWRWIDKAGARIYVCMYVCMYVTGIYIHTPAYVCMYVCMQVCGPVRGRRHVGTHKCARVRSELRTHARVLRARLRVRARELTHARARERMYVNDPCFGVVARVRGRTYVGMYVCMSPPSTYIRGRMYVCTYVATWEGGGMWGLTNARVYEHKCARTCVCWADARACVYSTP